MAIVDTTADRRPRRIRLTPLKGFRKREVKKLAKSSLAAGTNVVSDGLSCWRFVGVNTSLGNIKTAIAGTHTTSRQTHPHLPGQLGLEL